MRRRTAIAIAVARAAAVAIVAGQATAAPPSFDCSRAAGSVEQRICADDELAALDRDLAAVYANAARIAVRERPPTLKAEQRGWIKGRDECWKADDPRTCVEQAYRLRIAELRARYRLVEANGPYWFACRGNAADEVVVTYFATEPPTLIAERGDSVSLMYLQPSASGASYRGRNESFWTKGREARVTWGHGSAEMRCVLRRGPG